MTILNPLNLAENAPWRRRFQVAKIGWSAIATQNPAHGIVCTDRTGVYQLYAWDIDRGTLQQRTHYPRGIVQGYISADGRYIYYLQPRQGDAGHYARVRFSGGEAEYLDPDLPPYSSFYITESHSGSHLGYMAANQYGFQIYVRDNTTGDQVFSLTSENFTVGPVLSHDGDIAIVATNERSGTTDFMIEAYDIASGRKLGELYDGDAVNIQPVGFVPLPGDPRFLASTNRSGTARPLIWNPRTGTRQDLPLVDISGEITTWDWTDDGRYLLLRLLQRAEFQLLLYDLSTDALVELDHPHGTYTEGAFTYTGSIIASVQDAIQPPRLIELDRTSGEFQRLALPAEAAPQGTPWQSIEFSSDDGTTIQAWLVTPDDDPASAAPRPVIIHAHGGPTTVMTESYNAGIQAWVDHGFAFCTVNYRGSTTFGTAFQNAIRGRVGELEVQDLAAAARYLVDEGIAHPDQLFVMGSSYGGYLALHALGKTPALWRGGIAVAAIADWSMMYDGESDTLRGYQTDLFGGTPDDYPDRYDLASPITYADRVAADVLIIQGENDSRCPAEQMHAYIDTLRTLGKPVEAHWYDAQNPSGASSPIAHQALMLQFAYRILGDADES